MNVEKIRKELEKIDKNVGIFEIQTLERKKAFFVSFSIKKDISKEIIFFTKNKEIKMNYYGFNTYILNY